MSFVCDYWSDLPEEVPKEFVFVDLRLDDEVQSKSKFPTCAADEMTPEPASNAVIKFVANIDPELALTKKWYRPVDPKLFSVMDPFDDLAESCGPPYKAKLNPAQEHVV